MEGVVPLIIAIIILIIMSAYFSATETAFSMSNRIRLKNWSNTGNKSATRVLKILDNYDKFIVDVLVGNNIVNITVATLGTVLFTKLLKGADIALTLSTIVITLAVLCFGEILPKTIAKKIPEKFAMFSAPMIWFIGIILWPISYLFRLIQKIFSSKNKAKSVIVSNDELITIIQEAESKGDLDKDDSTLIKSAIEFNDVAVEEILVPRVDIVAVEEKSSMEKIKELFIENGFSRMPVYRKDIDHIVGYIHEKDFFLAYMENKKNISTIIKKIHATTTQTKISELLKDLQKNKEHISVVVDEFGGTEGIITMEDCLEELVGEIYDEYDDTVEMIHKVNDNTYLINANEDLDDVFEFLKIKPKEEFESVSLGGWILEMCGDMPKVGYKFEYGKTVFEVVKTDFRRIITVKVVSNKIDDKLKKD